MDTEDQVCPWCRKPILESDQTIERFADVEILGNRARRAHFRCEEGALARHKRYYLCFLALALVSTGVVLIGFLGDLTKGWEGLWECVVGVAGILATVFCLPRIILSRVRPWAEHVDEQREHKG